MECINVTIVDDDDFEVNQSFTIEVQTSSAGVQIGPNNTATVFIIDDDRK